MSVDEKTLNLYYKLSCALAAVACAFSLVAGMLMASNLVAVKTASPLNMPEIDQLRAALKENPTDELLRNKIRDLDVVSRRFYFAGLTSMRTGSLLLFGGIVVLLVSMRTAASLRSRLPNPREYPVRPDMLKSAETARWVIGGVALTLVSCAVAVGITERKGTKAAAAPVDAGKTGEVVIASTGAAAGFVPDAKEFATNWPAFRGPAGNGISAFPNAPVAWDVASGKGIVWKVKVPLPGMSSPVIWGNRLFLTGASESKREVYCFDMANGTLIWTAGVDAAPGNTNKVPKVSKDTGYAAATSVTDGKVIYSIFANGDIAALDFCAQKMWTADLGLVDNKYGYAASLAMYNGKILVQYDTGGTDGKVSQLIALDSATGKKVWAVDRPTADSWPSPLVYQTEKGPQLVTMANDWIIAYDPEKGKELWKVKCGGSEVAPSPIFAGGLVLASITAEMIYAIKPDGRGDVAKSHVAWKSEDGVSDVASPVSNGELAFLAHSGGTVTCLDVKTGKIVWDKSLEGEFYASPGISGDRVYLTARNGEVFIVRAARKFEEIGKMKLGEPCDCSPAFTDGRMFLRGMTNLFCIGNK